MCRMKRQIIDHFLESLIVNDTYHPNRQREENAARTSTAHLFVNASSRTRTIACACEGKGEHRNPKLINRDASDGSKKVCLGDDVIIKIRQTDDDVTFSWWRHSQTDYHFENRRTERTATSERSHKRFLVRLAQEHGTERRAVGTRRSTSLSCLQRPEFSRKGNTSYGQSKTV